MSFYFKFFKSYVYHFFAVSGPVTSADILIIAESSSVFDMMWWGEITQGLKDTIDVSPFPIGPCLTQVSFIFMDGLHIKPSANEVK